MTFKFSRTGKQLVDYRRSVKARVSRDIFSYRINILNSLSRPDYFSRFHFANLASASSWVYVVSVFAR